METKEQDFLDFNCFGALMMFHLPLLQYGLIGVYVELEVTIHEQH